MTELNIHIFYVMNYCDSNNSIGFIWDTRRPRADWDGMLRRTLTEAIAINNIST